MANPSTLPFAWKTNSEETIGKCFQAQCLLHGRCLINTHERMLGWEDKIRRSRKVVLLDEAISGESISPGILPSSAEPWGQAGQVGCPWKALPSLPQSRLDDGVPLLFPRVSDLL